MFTEALEHIRWALKSLPVGKMALAYAYARAGMKKEALDTIVELEKAAKEQYDMAAIANIYSAMGMSEECSQWLERLNRNGPVECDFRYRFYPWFARLWSDETLEQNSQRR
jgi:hypothetical protein